MPTSSLPTVLLLIGVSGAGKTTIGKEVAGRLGWGFFDADDYHPPDNVAKMQRGEGLTDEDRAPWLDAVRHLIESRLADADPAVIACSALKARYRARLHSTHPRVSIVWLDLAPETIARRLAEREGHFAGPSLLESQLDALERPASHEAARVSADGTVGQVAHRVLGVLGADGGDA